MLFTRIFKNADNEAAGRDEYAVRGQKLRTYAMRLIAAPAGKRLIFVYTSLTLCFPHVLSADKSF